MNKRTGDSGIYLIERNKNSYIAKSQWGVGTYITAQNGSHKVEDISGQWSSARADASNATTKQLLNSTKHQLIPDCFICHNSTVKKSTTEIYDQWRDSQCGNAIPKYKTFNQLSEYMRDVLYSLFSPQCIIWQVIGTITVDEGDYDSDDDGTDDQMVVVVAIDDNYEWPWWWWRYNLYII